MIKIILLTLLSSCATIPETKKPTPSLRYGVGDCALLVDPETGNYRKDDIMKVEAISDGYYVYRW